MKMPNPDHEMLVEAICDGKLEEVAQWLDKGVSPNGPPVCPAFARPLALAISSGHLEIAELLVAQGASPSTGVDALRDCIDNLEFGEWIDRIIADASPDLSESFQEAFVHACEEGKREIAEKILAVCPPPAEFTFRRCPLGQAICSQQTEIALWLIDVGFGPQSHLANEKPPVVYAIVADEPSVLKRLIEKGQSIDLKVSGHQTVFTCIPKLYSRLRHVRDFPKNEKFEVFHEGGLLHVAAVAGSPKCAALLLEAGLVPQLVDSEGRTPTMLAAIGGKHTAAVLTLLPEPDLKDPKAVLDLMTRGLHDGDADAVKKAIDHGFEVSTPIRTSYGVVWTPLTFAALHGHLAVVQTLIDSGADIDRSDWTDRKRPEMKGIRYLYNNGGLETFAEPAAPIDRTALAWAAMHGHVDVVKHLLDLGADRVRLDALSMTALHTAALGDQPKVISYLVDAGLDLHAEAFDKMTPLHVAAQVNAIASVKKLLALGADPTRLNKSGESPYLAAKQAGKPGAYRALEPHTPEELRKKKRNSKPPAPSLVGSNNERKKILAAAKTRFGKDAKQLSCKKTIDRLARQAGTDEFVAVAEAIRKKLKAAEWQRWDDTPQILCCENVKITDARLLKIQTEFLPQSVYLTRGLLRGDDGVTVHLVPTSNLFENFVAFYTDGINSGIHHELILAWLMDLHDRHPYELIGIGHDGVEPRFTAAPADPESLLRELLTICPPEDEEQAATKWLSKRLKSKTPQPFLWWD
ncbi:Ankyrin repeats (3 copies) [Rubripirellula tenax]|uniref:Ankyrin repeats (3 copies) n=1 Tax=Rubripirellula tenax TaxID=2528015 RepID=A0A5C6F4X6_9BACT|nr:ankyrin repeat domain-containing protein [Rubripirellula tenax]TWU56813.1 Ankyrin repeats (3 copies) [Rubripirellula tenax]